METIPYWYFNRAQWTACRDSIPMTLSEKDITRLQGVNEDLSIKEVEEIYLPLAQLISYYINAYVQRQITVTNFLGRFGQKVPYIISIAGSVAVGKSTTARVLQALLSQWPKHQYVELVTTDGFLYSNAVLTERGLMQQKGFPLSYDISRLIQFVSDIKAGSYQVTAPIYSHIMYDVIPAWSKIIQQPNILILEGLNVLQNHTDNHCYAHQVFVSDFVDFAIYVDASDDLLQNWYISRFLKFCNTSFIHPNSFFHHYAKLSDTEATNIARNIWYTINYQNLKAHILPTRERAHLIITKTSNHAVASIKLRK
ncbi:Pantothenate kinase [Candidatus Erwinia haradaeae]|uniref:Pantothenate kinase n=1 Tax=Candidatus Erwinia haradaeae TaxID=1922217 RepID=A0A451DCU7_9GAMM|nr:Pantothenate kinase [Candidatus Erwinia haradaeae]